MSLGDLKKEWFRISIKVEMHSNSCLACRVGGMNCRDQDALMKTWRKLKKKVEFKEKELLFGDPNQRSLLDEIAEQEQRLNK